MHVMLGAVQRGFARAVDPWCSVREASAKWWCFTMSVRLAVAVRASVANSSHRLVSTVA
jgi:hypothetical protein